MLLIFLDSETTGLNFHRHRIIEIAYRVFDAASGKAVYNYETLISQPTEVFGSADSESLAFNNITFEMALEGKTEIVVASEIIHDFNRLGFSTRGGVFICQNPSFDRNFLTQLIDADLQEKFGWPHHWLDLASMYYALRLHQDRWTLKMLKDHGLSKDKIAAFYGIPPEIRPHRAMRGVNHLIACYEAMFGKFST